MAQWQINKQQITDYLVKMVSINSVNPGLAPSGAGEAEIAAWLTETCSNLGLTVQTQATAPNRPNVIARWPGSGGGRSLLLTGHTDVVGVENMEIAPFKPEIKDGRLYGRGAFDMKGGLASILGAVSALRAADFAPSGDIILGFVTDEEYLSIGTEALAKTVQADAALLTEPTGLHIGTAHRGFAWITIMVEGRAAHGSLFDTGIDAIRNMRHVLEIVDRMEREIFPQRPHPLLERPSVHASLIEGGLGLSTYPDRCTLRIEHRLLPSETGADMIALWEAELDKVRAANRDFAARVSLDFERPGLEVDPAEPIMQTLDAAYQAVTGAKPETFGMPAWLDSAILAAAGIPTVIIGPGGDGAHAAVEYVNLDDVFRCAEILAETTARWTG